MRRSSYKPYVMLILSILLLLSLPYPVIDASRSTAAATLSPFWRWTSNLQAIVTTPISYMSSWFRQAPRARIVQLEEERQRYELENVLLKAQVDALLSTANEIDSIQRWTDAQGIDGETVQLSPAQVIFRSPGTWGSSLWIDIGEYDNRQSENSVAERNSPVVCGGSVLGVLDYVGERRSRVRLITDSGLRPSVRAIRKRRDGTTEGLAKGELQGQSQALWRQGAQLLNGIGFNYDTADDEGPARDLRSDDIIREGDLLVTTGMDGVFPQGLSVARVRHVDLLCEGAYYYTLTAEPTAPKLDDIQVVFVLPSRGMPVPEQL